MTVPEFVYTVLLRPCLLRRIANAAIKAVLPKNIRVGDVIIWINPNDPVVSGASTFRVYERDEISFFRSHISPHLTLIDVGVNVGLYTAIDLSSAGFQGKIRTIEPHAQSRSSKDHRKSRGGATEQCNGGGLCRIDHPGTANSIRILTIWVIIICIQTHGDQRCLQYT
jgi:hypothetical protein